MNVHGKCGNCGGMVTTPRVWGGVFPPTPTCISCCYVMKDTRPAIPMEKPKSIWQQGIPYSIMPKLTGE